MQINLLKRAARRAAVTNHNETTMNIALLSDIHANLPALEATLADIDQHQPDAIYCLGDLVGYNAWPNEVIDVLRARKIPVIKGNYDEGVGMNSDDCGCAYKTEDDKAMGQISIAFTNRAMHEAQRNYLRNLPAHLALDFRFVGGDALRVLLVHGSPRKINEYLFEDRDDKSLLRMMNDARADVMAFGHTHKPWHRAIPYDDNGVTRYRHAINTGSVGKPKDGDIRACWVMLHIDTQSDRRDAKSISVTFNRVSYDMEQAAQAMAQCGIPAPYVDLFRKAQ